MPRQAPVSHLALIRARNGHADHVGDQLNLLLQPARKALGCLDYQLHRSPAQPLLWVVQGVWSGPREMEAHFNSEPMRVLETLVASCAVSEMRFRTFEDVSQLADELAAYL